MRIWIVGKEGMVAESIQRVATEKGIDWFATSREEANLASSTSIREIFNREPFTHIINCAGYTAVELAESEEAEAFLINTKGVEFLATYAKERGKKLLHFSTDYVFDGRKESPYEEEDRCAPLSVYGKTKWLGEEKVLAIAPESCIVRTSWLFGRRGDHFVKKIAERMHRESSVSVVSDQRGRPTFCDDLALASMELLSHAGLFHFANRGESSWFTWAEEIYRILLEKGATLRCASPVPVTTKEYPTRAARPLYSVLSTKKAEALLSFTPRHWKEPLEEYLQKWYR